MSNTLKTQTAVALSCVGLAFSAGCGQEQGNDKFECGPNTDEEYKKNSWIFPCSADDNRSEVSCKGKNLNIVSLINGRKTKPYIKIKTECLDGFLSKDEKEEEAFQVFVRNVVKKQRLSR